jgi:hypothetical protein
MARVKNAVARENIPAEEEAASINTVRGGGHSAQDIVRMSDMDGKRNLTARVGQQLSHMHPFRWCCGPCQLYNNVKGRKEKKKTRGDCTKNGQREQGQQNATQMSHD